MAHYGHRDNFPTGAIATAMYATSKLMLQYAVEEVSKLARGSDGEYAACYPSFSFFPLPLPLSSALCQRMNQGEGGGGRKLRRRKKLTCHHQTTSHHNVRLPRPRHHGHHAPPRGQLGRLAARHAPLLPGPVQVARLRRPDLHQRVRGETRPTCTYIPSPPPPPPKKVKITTSFFRTSTLTNVRTPISRANFSAITCQTNNTKGELLLIGIFIQIIP